MKSHILFTTSFILILTLNGCGGGSSSTETHDTPTDPTPTTPTTPTNPTKPITIYPKVTITEEYQVESLGIANTINATVSLGDTAKDLYLVLSNQATKSTSSTITHNAKVIEEARSKSVSPTAITGKPTVLHAPDYVKEFRSNIDALLSKSQAMQPDAKTIAISDRHKDIAGDTQSFCVDIDLNSGNCIKYSNATVKKIISNITTSVGSKTLNIWVSDNSFDNGSGCIKSTCVTQKMVDALADTFLKTDSDNDVYDWVTNIYGEEWDVDLNGYTGFISANNEITILLTDIDEDNSPTGGVIGFFWSKDNFEKNTVSGSNERIMFYADAVMFANKEGLSWDINDFWPKEMVSTLAHEFQHMIHFYQKRILLDSDTDIWINEMLSESTEDLIATKIKHIGSRGIDYTDGSDGPTGNTNGRYPLFNANNTLSLTTWNNRLEDYSKVNAFGAYLIRNYGGAKLLHDIMHNNYMDQQAIVSAVNKSAEGSGKSFNDLLSEWGTAVLLSDTESPDTLPTYNTGWFTDNIYGNSIYELGSINFFNYDPLPTIYTQSGTVQSQGNYYYKVGDNLTGDITINLELNGQTEVTLIAK